MVAIMKFNIYSYSQMTCQYAVRFVFLMTIYHRLEQTFVNIFFLRLNEIKDYRSRIITNLWSYVKNWFGGYI
jgi:hypothetical protein